MISELEKIYKHMKKSDHFLKCQKTLDEEIEKSKIKRNYEIAKIDYQLCKNLREKILNYSGDLILDDWNIRRIFKGTKNSELFKNYETNLEQRTKEIRDEIRRKVEELNTQFRQRKEEIENEAKIKIDEVNARQIENASQAELETIKVQVEKQKKQIRSCRQIYNVI